jgi:predicted TIM-barrel fold metal-dependent hydrolase
MKIIDCDSHYLPPTVFNNVSEQFRDRLPSYHFDSAGGLTEVKYANDPILVTENYQTPAAFNTLTGLTSIDSRIDDFSKLKITSQFLAPQESAMRFNYSVDALLAADMCHSYNVEVKKVVDAHPLKFFAAALLPLQNMSAAVNELSWAIANGFKSVYVDNIYLDKTGVCKPVLDLEGIEEIVSMCEANGIVIYFHSMMHHIFPFGESFRSIQSVLPSIIHINLYSVVTSGIFDRYPKLQVVFAEGADEFALGILDTLNRAAQRGKFTVQNEPIFYFKNNISIALDIEKTELVNKLLHRFGSERLLFSTDYPHNDESGANMFNDTWDLLKLGLSRIDLENIAYRNAEKLFQLA